MTENTEEKESQDDIVLARAMVIRAESGGSLTDAMVQAESELARAAADPAFPETFTVTLEVKPRVSRWIMATFGGHAILSVEERLAAFLVMILNQSRIKAIRTSEPPPEIGRGGAVSVRRANMPDVGS